MKIIKLIMIMPLMTFLTNCRTQLTCAEIKSYKINFIPMYDVSFKFNRCRVRCFDINNWETVEPGLCNLNMETETFSENGKPFQAINLPIEACDGMAGFMLTDEGKEVRPKIKALAKIRDDICGL